MPRYQDTFRLDLNDIDTIEQALRAEIARFSRSKAADTRDKGRSRRITELNCLLGKIHNQKLFYSQVNETDAPAG
jgi:hypothetical protein